MAKEMIDNNLKTATEPTNKRSNNTLPLARKNSQKKRDARRQASYNRALQLATSKRYLILDIDIPISNNQ
jgi:hypothetical protein